MRKKERKKNWCFWAMDVEKNFTSSLDREENKPFSFRRRETQKITWSDSPPIKVRCFGHVMRAKRSLERDIMLGQVEGHRKQGKPRMRWLDSNTGATGLRLEDLREAVQDRKNGVRRWKKRLRIECAQMWSEFRRRQWQTTPVQLNLPGKSSVKSPEV